jgi:probable rRNA maturation factor
MRVIVESWDKKFNILVPKIRRTTLKLGRLLGLTNVYLEIYLVGNRFMKKNVLAFPAPKEMPRPDIRGQKALGEIYLNPDYIQKEHLEIAPPLDSLSIKKAGSRRGGRNLKLEIPSQKLAYMLIHGFLHLLGYDHKKKSDRILMERKEAKLIKHV